MWPRSCTNWNSRPFWGREWNEVLEMKKVNYTLTVEEEKLAALRRYMGRKELELDTEMELAFQKLYDRHVPSAVRDYIEESESEETGAIRRPQRPRTTEQNP